MKKSDSRRRMLIRDTRLNKVNLAWAISAKARNSRQAWRRTDSTEYRELAKRRRRISIFPGTRALYHNEFAYNGSDEHFFTSLIKYAGITNIYARFPVKIHSSWKILCANFAFCKTHSEQCETLTLLDCVNYWWPSYHAKSTDTRCLSRGNVCVNADTDVCGDEREKPSLFRNAEGHFKYIKPRAIFHFGFAANGIEKLPVVLSREGT